MNNQWYVTDTIDKQGTALPEDWVDIHTSKYGSLIETAAGIYKGTTKVAGVGDQVQLMDDGTVYGTNGNLFQWTPSGTSVGRSASYVADSRLPLYIVDTGLHFSFDGGKVWKELASEANGVYITDEAVLYWTGTEIFATEVCNSLRVDDVSGTIELEFSYNINCFDGDLTLIFKGDSKVAQELSNWWIEVSGDVLDVLAVDANGVAELIIPVPQLSPDNYTAILKITYGPDTFSSEPINITVPCTIVECDGGCIQCNNSPLECGEC
jgi:hypothetical protein